MTLSSAALIACGSEVDSELRQLIQEQNIDAIEPVGIKNSDQFELGQMLFFDKELSGNRDIACASCHHPTQDSADGLSLSIGTGGGTVIGPERSLGAGKNFVPRHAPDLFNRGLPQWNTMFWDNRVAGTQTRGFQSPAGNQLPKGFESVLAVQAVFPITSRVEMRGNMGDKDVFGNDNEIATEADMDFPAIWSGLVNRLKNISKYGELFQAVYDLDSVDDISIVHVGNALGSFQAAAFSFTDSPWDNYLRGDDSALSMEQKKGALLFFGNAGCSSCHSGNLLSDQALHNIAVPQLGPGKDLSPPLDFGREEMSMDPSERFAFRTPPLRNVELTAPYMHNGAFMTLAEVIEHYDNLEKSFENYDGKTLDARFSESLLDKSDYKSDMFSSISPTADRRLDLSLQQKKELLAFLKALTDEAAKNLSHLMPSSVPSDLPVD